MESCVGSFIRSPYRILPPEFNALLLIPRSVPSFSPSIMAYKSKLCFLSFYQNVL